jgi:1,4-dihydroxy-2-naphthoate octaprenyltransferase
MMGLTGDILRARRIAIHTHRVTVVLLALVNLTLPAVTGLRG